MEEVRKYWELPAVAHFCSLFRGVFKLIDFDIEDFEEALVVDTDCADKGGRSTLIVDLLIALLKGNSGRRDISLLNYNHFCHDLLSERWEKMGLGKNPLGPDRDSACFHALPAYTKLKLLHFLCEWRLERPDVEPVTKNLDGDSLRVNPLGKDDDGNVYWYFYGTRLYKEKPKPVKIKIKAPTPQKSKNEKTSRTKKKKPIQRKSKSKRKTVNPKKSDFVSPVRRSSRQAKKAAHRKIESSGEESMDSEQDSDSEELQRLVDLAKKNLIQPSNLNSEHGDEVVKKEPAEDISNKEESELESCYNRSSLVTRIKTQLVSASGRSSPSSSDVDGPTFKDLISRIYSRDEDDEDSKLSATLNSGEDGENKWEEVDKMNIDKDVVKEEVHSVSEKNIKEESKADLATEVEFSSISVCSFSKVGTEEEKPTAGSGAVENGTLKPDNVEIGTVKEEGDIKNEPLVENEKLLWRESGSSPHWDQELLTPNIEETRRWELACCTLEDWQELAEKFKQSTSKTEKELCFLLVSEFLPEMDKLYAEKEREKQRKIAELMPRRSSDRLEVKKLQREEEKKKLAERERVEWEKIQKFEEEDRKKQEQEKRENRLRARELEKERIQRLKERAREERSRRLNMRQQRQELAAAGMEIPPELMNTSNTLLDDSDLNELDIEIELEHMYGQLEKVLDMIKSCPESEPFLHPVSKSEAPDYYDKIPEPMDFETVENNLLERQYKNKFEFIDDVNTIFLNCLLYNGWKSEYTKLAQKCERVFIRAFKKYFPPSEMTDKDESAVEEGLEIVEKLGALDRKIREILGEKIEVPKKPQQLTKRQVAADMEQKKRKYNYSEQKPIFQPVLPLYKKPRTFAGSFRPLPSGGAAHDFAHLTKKPPAVLSKAYSGFDRVKQAMKRNSLTPQREADPDTPKWKIRPTSTEVAQKYANSSLNRNPNRYPVPNVVSRPLYQNQSSPQTAPRRFLPPSVVSQTSRVYYSPPQVSPKPGGVSQVFLGRQQQQQRQQNATCGSLSVQKSSSEKPNVYLIPMPDGNRLLKFVDKAGNPIPGECVSQLLPQIRKEAYKFPKGLVTLTVSSDQPAHVPASSASPLPTLSSTATHVGRVSTPVPVVRQRTPAVTLVKPLTPPVRQVTEVAVSKIEEPKISIPVSPVSSPVTGSGSGSVGGRKPDRKLYHIGANSYLSIEDKIPYLLKRQENGEFVKISEVSRDELVQKLNTLKEQKQVKPVCSVAPQPKPQHSPTVGQQPTSTVYLQSTTQNQPPVAVVFNQNPQQKREAVIVGSGSLGGHPTQAIVLSSPGVASSSSGSQQQVQVIQFQVPQIVLNTDGATASRSTVQQQNEN